MNRQSSKRSDPSKSGDGEVGTPSQAAPSSPPRSRAKGWTIAGIVVLAVVVRMPFLASPGFVGDQYQFIAWAGMARQGGLDSVYQLRPDGSGKHSCNYPPGYVYVLRVLADVYRLASGGEPDDTLLASFVAKDDTREVRLAAAVFKLPAVVADVGLSVLLLVWLSRRIGRTWAGMVAGAYALMPSVIHNSAIWGQVDAVSTLLLVASLEAARRRQIPYMALSAAAAILVKPQAVAVAPVWLMATASWAGWRWLAWGRAAMIGLLVMVAAILPFHEQFDGVWRAYFGAAGYYPFTHLNGFSVWFLGGPMIQPHLGEMEAASARWPLTLWYAHDTAPGPLGLTPRTCGLVSFASVAAWALIILGRRRCNEASILWMARLLPAAFFVLCTQMHERYLFPAVAVWAWAARPSGRWLAGWLLLGSCASINVLWAWPGPADAIWVTWLEHWLHRPWFGLAPGVWCSGALVLLLLATLLGLVDDEQIPAVTPTSERD